VPYLELMYDMRLPEFAQVSAGALYAAMLEQSAWADVHGFDAVHFGEHHTADDGYLPSTVTAAAAVAGRTAAVRLRVMAVAPFHHPIRLAEDLAVLDLLSGGRVSPVVLAGYRPAEFELYGVRREDRRATVRRAVQVLQQAWTGEPFEFDGRTVRVTPTPVQSPRPRVLMGGSHASVAREAAEIADGFRAPGGVVRGVPRRVRAPGPPGPGPVAGAGTGVPVRLG
jgi:alkanesulfonate monooxygenase SsuD/methylene tetrahydromethanopterin reductase-like flavin-dependent oxidoreductase (luciferase family)